MFCLCLKRKHIESDLGRLEEIYTWKNFGSHWFILILIKTISENHFVHIIQMISVSCCLESTPINDFLVFGINQSDFFDQTVCVCSGEKNN